MSAAEPEQNTGVIVAEPRRARIRRPPTPPPAPRRPEPQTSKPKDESR